MVINYTDENAIENKKEKEKKLSFIVAGFAAATPTLKYMREENFFRYFFTPYLYNYSVLSIRKLYYYKHVT